MPAKKSIAACDPDVAIARNYIDHWVNFGHLEAVRALERIEKRLEAGKEYAEIVEAYIKAGHIHAVPYTGEAPVAPRGNDAIGI